jgi:hypothetical protein
MPRRKVAAGLALLIVVPAPAREAWACAPAPPPGVHVDVADEEALIIWDAASRTQHFVRRVRFRTPAPDFGFLVPTPTRPTLAEAKDAVFETLSRAIEPQVSFRRRQVYRPVPLLLWPFFFTLSAPHAPPAAGVRVLETKRVAGYDAAVLQADDAKALLAWLSDHRYAARPELLEWLKPYVDRKWILTAFKVGGRDAGSGEVATSAVRMSFETDKPFFPYREPADQRGGDGPRRLLRVFAVATERLEGRVGATGTWAGKLRYAWPRPDMGLLLDGVGAGPPGSKAPWLLAWDDESTPRPGTDDLFFSRAADQAPVVPPPVVVDFPVVFPIPVDIIGLLVLGAWWLRRRARRAEVPRTPTA